MFARRFRLCQVLLIVALAAQGAGCRRGRPELPPEPPPGAASATASDSAPPAPAPTPPVKDEVYGDPSLLAEPRLQFIWNPVKARTAEYVDFEVEHHATIYTMKLDGTDLRRAIAPEALYAGDLQLLTSDKTPVRSPDGRWIAVVGMNKGGSPARFLVDLKEKKVRTMMVAGAAVHFNWSPDSRKVYFYGDLELWQYEVATGKLSKMPFIPSEGLHLVDGGRRFLAVNEEWVTWYDLRGKELRKQKLPFTANHLHAVSPDGKLLAGVGEAGTVIVALAPPVSVLHQQSDRHGQYAFASDGTGLFYVVGGIARLDLRTWAVSEIPYFGGQAPGGLTTIGPAGKR